MVVTYDAKTKKLVITLDTTEPTLSKGGKMHLVASTGGFQTTPVLINGKPLRIAVNAGI